MDRAASDKTLHIPQFKGSDGARLQGQTKFMTTIQGVLGVLLPAAFAGVGKMQQAIVAVVADPGPNRIGLEENGQKHFRDITGVSRRGELVRNSRDIFAFAGAFDYCINEARALRAEDP